MQVKCIKLGYDRFITYLSKLLLTPPTVLPFSSVCSELQLFRLIDRKLYGHIQLYTFLCLTNNSKIHEIRIYKNKYSGIHESLEPLQWGSQTSHGQVVTTSKVYKITVFFTQFNVKCLLTIPIITIILCKALFCFQVFTVHSYNQSLLLAD